MLKNKYYYVIILLNRIHVSGNTIGLHPEKQKLEPPSKILLECQDVKPFEVNYFIVISLSYHCLSLLRWLLRKLSKLLSTWHYRDFREKGRGSLTQTLCKFSSSLFQAQCSIFRRRHPLPQITRVLFLLGSFYFRDVPSYYLRAWHRLIFK